MRGPLYAVGHGAIGRLVAPEFMALTAIGALLGLPVAFVAIGRYLAGFTEQAPVGVWTLGAALVIAAVVALGSTVRHALATIRLRPVQALRGWTLRVSFLAAGRSSLVHAGFVAFLTRFFILK